MITNDTKISNNGATQMTLVLELTPEQEARLQANAAIAGQAPVDYVRGWLEQLPATPASDADALLKMFRQWEEDTAQLTTDQLAAEDEGWDEITTNLRTNRVSLPVPDISAHD